MKKNFTLLVAPLHYVLTNNSGSEFSWSYELFKGLSKYYSRKVKFITGGTVIKSSNVINLRIIDPEHINLSLINVIKFHLFSQVTALKFFYSSKILMHMLPFSIGKSINLLFFLPFTKNIKVIGPVQLNLEVQDTDLDVSDARGFKKASSNNTPSLILKRIFLRLTGPNLIRLNLVMLKKADKVIAISSVVRDRLVGLGVDGSKIVVIPTGINVNAFLPNKELVQKDNVFTIITTSYLLKRKNINLIVEAVSNIYRKGLKVRLLVVGDGPQLENLKKQVGDLGLQNVVEFTGFVKNSEIKDYYYRADAFVSMSSSESWGQVYLEAMACGLPIISSRNSGSSVIVEQGVNGYLVPLNSVNDLERKILYLMKNKDKQKEISLNCRRIVKERYDWESVVIPKYINLLKTLYES